MHRWQCNKHINKRWQNVRNNTGIPLRRPQKCVRAERTVHWNLQQNTRDTHGVRDPCRTAIGGWDGTYLTRQPTRTPDTKVVAPPLSALANMWTHCQPASKNVTLSLFKLRIWVELIPSTSPLPWIDAAAWPIVSPPLPPLWHLTSLPRAGKKVSEIVCASL